MLFSFEKHKRKGEESEKKIAHIQTVGMKNRFQFIIFYDSKNSNIKCVTARVHQTENLSNERGTHRKKEPQLNKKSIY